MTSKKDEYSDMVPLVIRRAETTDANALKDCITAAYAKYERRIPDMPSVAVGIKEDIVAKQVWVVTEKNKLIAGLFLWPQDGFMKLVNLAVHPSHAGKGLGRQLLELSEEMAEQQGFSEIWLNTHKAIADNIEIYTHLGWEEVSLNGNTVSMRKRICSS